MLGHKYQIGNFDRKVRIIQKVITTNDFNGETETWELYARKWAKEESKTGYEIIEADKNTARRKSTYVIRYDSAVDEEMKLVSDDLVYGIISIKQPQGVRKRFLELEVELLEGETDPTASGAFTSGFTVGFQV